MPLRPRSIAVWTRFLLGALVVALLGFGALRVTGVFSAAASVGGIAEAPQTNIEPLTRARDDSDSAAARVAWVLALMVVGAAACWLVLRRRSRARVPEDGRSP